jgi:hypothetical protein
MIQQLIYDRFGVLYNVFYMAQLLKPTFKGPG